ncbi:cupin domain-containing protein [Microbacterium trichothecenolyticum]|uniref:glucose-6-phosphate isomerase family protein n=1 Tax=Microbacterium trichothecenolyticum TaxID=69370 RepID=UPI001C6F357E|nr:glucose-6-phosphate isomerase family protein [Microbacterium trichothecenolyticum]MBW9122428.1 cupin domain-containing protein [Microbacterium trichothecenolyticum]
MSTHPVVDTPVLLEISNAGGITGRSRRYEKRLGDMQDVYRDQAAWEAAVAEHGADQLVYWVDDHRYQEGSGALIVGTSTVLPGRMGTEFALTRGHLHEVSDRAELYYCLSGRGVMLMDTLDGQSSAIELTPGKAVDVPGHWIHRSVNVGDEPFVTLFCYAADAGQDYGVIADAGGMKNLVVADGDGWALVPNPEHVGYRAYVAS